MGWFTRKSKKPAQPEAPPPPPVGQQQADGGEATALIQRWDAAIAAILGELDSVLAEAVAGSGPLIDATQSDLTPLTLPWNTIEVRHRELGDKVAETWDELSDLMSECDTFTDDMMDREGSKRDAAAVEIEIRYMQAYGSVMARAAEKMRHVALAQDASSRECQYCGATLDKVEPVSEALNIECGYCQAINTLDPGTALRMFAAMGAHHLAEAAALADRASMMRAENLMHQYRDSKDVPLGLLEQFERSARGYHSTRLNVEAQLNPEQAKHVETKLERYMKDAHKTLCQYRQWRQRGSA